MKNRLILSLAGLLFVSMLVISPVSANKVVYRANGTLDRYNDPIYLGAIVFQGSWNLRIDGDGVDFKIVFLEENILEEIPGTLDKFKIVLANLDFYVISDSVCVLEGLLEWDKTGWDSADGYIGDPPGKIYFSEFQLFVRITIDPSEIMIVWDFANDYGFEGSTLSLYSAVN